jgi:selenocysteine lyase/cysteine desulfurase
MALTRRKFVLTSSLSAGAALLARGGVVPPQQSANDLSKWANVRALFNLSPDWTHAALFAFVSHPRPVRDAVERNRKALDANPYDAVEEGAFGGPEHNLMDQSAAAVARYIGANASDIALTTNTTNGLALLYHGLPLKAGDEILTSVHDHIVHHESIRYANLRSGATARKLTLFPPHDASAATPESIVARLREGIGPKTRVLGVTWVHSSSGLKLPLAEIAKMVREVNASRPASDRIWLIVDGVHGVGATEPEIVATGIDAIASGLHKWMLAPRGTGFVWARPELWAILRPTAPAFTAFELYEAWIEERTPAGPARASWFGPGGYQAYEHLWGVPAAVALHETIGSKRVATRIRELNGAAKEELAKMPHVSLRTPRSGALSAGIIAFEVNGMKPQEVTQRLRQKKVIASTSPYRITYPRLSFGIANSEADVETALAAVRSLRG